MTKLKQSRSDLQDKKTQALIAVVQRLLNENSHLRDLAVGTLETVKLMPGYDKAIKAITNKAKEIDEVENKKLEI